MADVEIKASHEKAKNAYGQNGSPQASSLLPGKKKSSIAGISPPQAAVPSLLEADTLGHRVAMGADGRAVEYKAHDSMSHRAPDSGSPGGVNVIPSKTNRPDKRR